MDTSSQGRPKTRSQLSGCLTLVLLSAAVFVGVALGVLYMKQGSGPVADDSEADRVEWKSGAAVVAAVRDLARLQTTSWHMEKVIDIREKQNSIFGLVRAEDALLLVAAGDVVAGVDLSVPDAVQVEVTEDRAVVTLPPAQVFSARLDSERTYVHTRDTDLLARRSEKLESRARQAAEATLRTAALDAGILDRAEQSAARSVRSLVSALGFGRVDVQFRSSVENESTLEP